MALTTATVAKNTSDTNRTPASVNGLAIGAINTAINAAAGAGEYVIRKTFEARISDGITSIKQSDDSYVDVETIVLALKENGYRAAYNKRNDPGDYALCLQVAWG